MGTKPYDKYTLLHFAVGIIAYFFDITLLSWILLHVIFEIVENSKYGVQFIDTYLTFWPGGKKSSDNIINSLSDIIFSVIGWLVAYLVAKNEINS